MMRASQRSTVAENFTSFICSPASSSFIGSVRTSMNSVSTPARPLVRSKTKRAACSLSRPCRAVPLFIPVILGTARQGRESEHAARFVFEQTKTRADVETELIDVRSLPMRLDDAGEQMKDAAFQRRSSDATESSSLYR